MFALAVRLLLGLIFLFAGGAKLADRKGSLRSLQGFGVPDPLATCGALGLPLVELGIGVTLLFHPISRWGAIAALMVLVVFSAAIAVNLLLGRTPECHCFGQIHSEPASFTTLARNGALAALAAWLAWHGPEQGLSWSEFGVTETRDGMIAAAFAIVVVLVGLSAALQWQILVQQGRLLSRMEAMEGGMHPTAAGLPTRSRVAPGLPVGVLAPGFRLTTLDGRQTGLNDLLTATRPLLMVFSNPLCGPCQSLMPDIRAWQRDFGNAATIVLVSEGSVADNKAKADAYGLDPQAILLQTKREVADSYQAWGTPGAVIVRPDGTIAAPIASGPDAIRELALQLHPQAAAPQQQFRVAPTISLDEAMGIQLRDRKNKRMSLKEFVGRPMVLLFWNPHCGFCQAVLTALQAWDKEPHALELVLISNGPTADDLGSEFRSTVLLDTGFALGPAFGANGTPMAIAIDPDGRISTGPVAGGDAVMRLLNTPARAEAELVA